MNRVGEAFRFYVGSERESLPNATLRHYRNLRWHRSTILEGIRRLAVRNINHRVRAMIRLGVGEPGRQVTAKAVFDRLHEDQGMGADVNSRQMVDYINTVPWEMYLCLLYVELESYLSASRRDPGLVFRPLEEFLDSKSAAVENLKTVRDKVLHPAKGIELGDALDSFMNAGTHVDGHLPQTGVRRTATTRRILCLAAGVVGDPCRHGARKRQKVGEATARHSSEATDGHSSPRRPLATVHRGA